MLIHTARSFQIDSIIDTGLTPLVDVCISNLRKGKIVITPWSWFSENKDDKKSGHCICKVLVPELDDHNKLKHLHIIHIDSGGTRGQDGEHLNQLINQKRVPLRKM